MYEGTGMSRPPNSEGSGLVEVPRLLPTPTPYTSCPYSKATATTIPQPLKFHRAQQLWKPPKSWPQRANGGCGEELGPGCSKLEVLTL